MKVNHIVNFKHIISGESIGREGRYPGPKLGQIVCWRSFWKILDPPLMLPFFFLSWFSQNHAGRSSTIIFKYFSSQVILQIRIFLVHHTLLFISGCQTQIFLCVSFHRSRKPGARQERCRKFGTTLMKGRQLVSLWVTSSVPLYPDWIQEMQVSWIFSVLSCSELQTHVKCELLNFFEDIGVFSKWSEPFIEFSEFREFRESEKSLRHELGSE